MDINRLSQQLSKQASLADCENLHPVGVKVGLSSIASKNFPLVTHGIVGHKPGELLG